MAETTPLHSLTSAAGAVYMEQAGWQIPAHFGDPQAEYQKAIDGCVLFDRSSTGKIELTGGDVLSYFHNLSTNDIKDLPIGAGCEAFLTTNKAKVVSYLFVYHILLRGDQEALWLDVPPGTSEQVIQHLDRFLISEQVEMADRTREFAQIHLAGPSSTRVLEAALGDDVPPLEELQHMMRTFGDSATAHVRKHSPLGVPGYDIAFLRSRADTVWQALTRAGALPAGEQTWEVLRIEAGTPQLGTDIDDTTFAPETGRIAQAISYAKGCYLGQEPIVMARDRGQINRHLMGLKLSGGPAPRNSKLFAGDREAGRITSCVQSPRMGTIALGYVRRGQEAPGNKLEVEVEGQRAPIEVTALPFLTKE